MKNKRISTDLEIKNGIIYFAIKSDGTTGHGWLLRHKKNDISVSEWAESILLSPDFIPTTNIVSRIAIIKSSQFPNENISPNLKNIRLVAPLHNLIKPRAESACIIREIFSDFEIINDIGLKTIIVIHKPIKDLENKLSFLSVHAENEYGDNDRRTLHAQTKKLMREFNFEPEDGFAFEVKI